MLDSAKTQLNFLRASKASEKNTTRVHLAN